jgi:hypothetical protein
MSTIFTELASALAPYVGGFDVAGAILAMITIGCIMAGFTLMFGRDFIKSQTGFVLFLAIVGFLSIPNVTGWIPIWVPFLIVLSLALIYWQKYL